MILKRPRDRQDGDINPDPPATAQLQHAITWKPYGLVPFFGYKYHTVALVNNSYFNILLCLQLILETELIGVVQATDFGNCLLIGIVQTIDFGDGLLDLSRQRISEAIY